MSTFKEICESILEEANGRPVTLTSVNLGKDSDGVYYLTDPTQRNIVRWVNDLNLQIQQSMIQANFMHKRGAFITTVNGTEVYTKKYVREIDRYSAYVIKSGETARTLIEVKEYDDWLQDERSSSSTNSRPLELIRNPEDKWIVDPTPDEVYTIYADWWREPAKFDSADDEPLWDSTYHDILKWKGLGLFAAEYSEEGAGKILLSRINQMLPSLERSFIRRYVRSIGPAPALGE
jgi:hypothetical protein